VFCQLHLCFVLVSSYLRLLFCVCVRCVLLQSRLTGGDRKATCVAKRKKSRAAKTLLGSGVRICRSSSENPFRLLPRILRASSFFLIFLIAREGYFCIVASMTQTDMLGKPSLLTAQRTGVKLRITQGHIRLYSRSEGNSSKGWKP
jgi:hypothetical protein